MKERKSTKQLDNISIQWFVGYANSLDFFGNGNFPGVVAVVKDYKNKYLYIVVNNRIYAAMEWSRWCS